MAKNKYDVKKYDIDLTFQHISCYINDQKWWADEKKRLKAVKLYKQLKLKKLFTLTKQDYEKYAKSFLKTVNDWCKRCIDSKQWKKLTNSISQPQQQIKELKQENSISLSDKAYTLLQDLAKQENTSISEVIISRLSKKEKISTIKTDDSEEKAITKESDNIQLDAIQPIAYKHKKKGSQSVIELWQFAGGQCQALSKATHKRCKRITPDLSMKQQEVDGVIYEFSVCHTHNNDKSQLDSEYIKPKK